ncbi:hypothetical protein PENARI_c001G09519 [Penicillium arizonense]|uniref:Jacalin-type lectin domain-containing protein n=1 Tax=Penicillium arizonense TaxID=1835702 RepID=A0A1F5LYL8_PENAI|nr:hypothetical protein PENARI_c001G09519 [Penicillium arizonense]OGE58267.1 hypothetical protein PENARI_c001G09519 [Penicillium arizonense]
MGTGKWGDYSEFIFEDASETVKSLSLWGNGKGTNLGRIKFTTSKGRTFDCGGHGGKTEYPMDVVSGLWVGIRGNCGATVDNMSVFFLTRVDSMKIKDVKFKNDSTGTSQGIKPKVLKSTQFPWHGKPYDYKFERPRLETESHTINDRDENQGGQQYSEEQALGEDESTYALLEQGNRRRGYNTYRDEKEATVYVDEESSYRDNYQQQKNAWRGNRDETVF